MDLLKKFLSIFRKLLRRRNDDETILTTDETIEQYRARKRLERDPDLCISVMDQDIGKFMKVHGRQSKEYRASIFEKVPVEEDDKDD